MSNAAKDPSLFLKHAFIHQDGNRDAQEVIYQAMKRLIRAEMQADHRLISATERAFIQ